MRIFWFPIAIATVATSVQAQTALLVVAHGAESEWNAPVRETVDAVSWGHGPKALAFLMGPEARTSGWDSVLVRLVGAGARRIVVVPLMVSSHGEHYAQVRYYAGEANSLPAALRAHHATHRAPQVPMRVTGALDDAPELAAALAERLEGLDPRDRARPLLLLAHGPGDSAAARAWVENLDRVAAGIAPGPRGPLRIGLLLDDADAAVRAGAIAALRDTVSALAARAGDSVLVLPVLLSTGRITRMTIPHDLRDLPVRYVAVALTPSAPLSRWIERVAARAAEELATAARPH